MSLLDLSMPPRELLNGLSGDEELIGVNPAAFREGQEVEIAKPAK